MNGIPLPCAARVRREERTVRRRGAMKGGPPFRAPGRAPSVRPSSAAGTGSPAVMALRDQPEGDARSREAYAGGGAEIRLTSVPLKKREEARSSRFSCVVMPPLI